MAPPSFASHDWYDTPQLYDCVFAGGTATETDFLEAMVHQYGLPRGRRVLEPACGSGRLVEALAQRGWGVQGFDLNPAMVAFAQARVETLKPRPRITLGDMAQFTSAKPVHMAHCLVSTFKYLLTESDARAHLQCVADALLVGGLYILGFHLTDYDSPSRQRERWFGRSQGAHVTCNIQTWPADRRLRREKVRARLTINKQNRRKTLQTEWLFRTYNAAQFRKLLRCVPSLEHVATYDFGYDTHVTRAFDDMQLDCVLILRRRNTSL